MQKRLEPHFVEFVPDELDEATLYISMTYGTASHLCCCGCGTKVVTPITPTDWSMRFDGDTVSLFPSIGNWDQPCRSHYVIERNRVIPHGPCSEEDIKASLSRRSEAKARCYGTSKASAASGLPVEPPGKPKPLGLLEWLKRWL